jgi:hypothetical protein
MNFVHTIVLGIQLARYKEPGHRNRNIKITRLRIPKFEDLRSLPIAPTNRQYPQIPLDKLGPFLVFSLRILVTFTQLFVNLKRSVP